MNFLKPSTAAFFAACGLNLAQANFYYNRLPERVASHFGADGSPNGWAPKDFFVGLYAGAVVLMAVTLFAASRSVSGKPDNKINLPNKDYWLAPERRAATFAWMTAALEWFGVATFALLFDVFGQAFRFNLDPRGGLAHPGTSLAVYLGFTAVWMTVFLRKFFSRPG